MTYGRGMIDLELQKAKLFLKTSSKLGMEKLQGPFENYHNWITEKGWTLMLPHLSTSSVRTRKNQLCSMEGHIHMGSQKHSCLVLHQLNYGLQDRNYKPLLEASIYRCLRTKK